VVFRVAGLSRLECESKMIEFTGFGLLAGVPIGVAFFFLARWKRRSEKAWGLSMWVLASLWITGATALPSVAGGLQNRAVANPIVVVMAGCFVLQIALAVVLLLARRSVPEARPASKKRTIVLLAILVGLVLLSVLVAIAI
jgi:hypothetical protein